MGFKKLRKKSSLPFDEGYPIAIFDFRNVQTVREGEPYRVFHSLKAELLSETK